MGASRDCVLAFKALLELVKQIAIAQTPANKAKLATYSKEVVVGELVHGAEKLKSMCCHGYCPRILYHYNDCTNYQIIRILNIRTAQDCDVHCRNNCT